MPIHSVECVHRFAGCNGWRSLRLFCCRSSWVLWIRCTICENNRDAVDDGVAAAAALAVYRLGGKLQGLMAHRTDQQANILGRKSSRAHGSILSYAIQRCATLARYHGRDDKYFSNFGWRRDRRADQG